MQTSKTALIKALFGFYTLLSLAACNLPSPKDKQDGSSGSTFTAQAMADKSKALDPRVKGSFDLPSSKVFNFQACVKDMAYDKPIIGHDFLVEELNKKVTSDKAGCVTWSENVEYNFLGESQYIRVERHLKGTGLHKGSQLVAYAINPWSHGEALPAVLNPDDGNKIPRLVDDVSQTSMALKGFSLESQKSVTRPLWVEDGRLFVTEQKMTAAGVDLLVEMRPSPSIQLTKMNGEMFLRPLTAGSFKASLKLIHSYQQQDGKVINRLLAETPLMDAKMENGSLAIRKTMSLTAIPTRGQVFLGLELQPVNGPEGLTSFEGVYLIGDYDQLKITSFLKLDTSVAQMKNFKLSNFINSTLADLAPASPDTKIQERDGDNKGGATTGQPKPGSQTTLPPDIYQKPKVEVAKLEFTFLSIGTEKTSSREIRFNVKANVRSGLDQKVTRSQTFKITKFRQSETEPAQVITVQTDNNAYVTWDEVMTFKVFDCQHFIKGFVTIENTDLGMSQKLDIALNPWESGNGALVAHDLRFVESKEQLPYSCSQESRPRTRVKIDSFNFNTSSFAYHADSFLSLTTAKNVQIRMTPRMLIYSSVGNGRDEYRSLRDGIYLLRTAIIQNRDYDVNNTFVTSADALVNVIGGEIDAVLTYKTQDPKAFGNRNNILLEIYPVDENKVVVSGKEIHAKNAADSLESLIDTSTGLESPTFVGSINLYDDDGSRNLMMVDASSVNNLFINGQEKIDVTEKFLVKKVVEQGQKIAAEKLQKLQAKADKTQYAKDNNLELLNLNTADPEAPLVKAYAGSTQLVQRLIMTNADLKEFVKTGELNPAVAQKFCAFWNNDYFRKLYEAKGGVFWNMAGGLSMGFGADCYHSVVKTPQKFFLVEKYLLLKETPAQRFQVGTNEGWSVGSSFSLNASHSNSTSRSKSISAKAGISHKFFDLISVGADMTYTMSWSETDSKGAANSVSVNANTNLVRERTHFQFRSQKYEQCAVIRLNPLLFVKSKSWFGPRDYVGLLNPRLSEDELTTAVTRGFMICDGEITTTPKDFEEDYFLVYQPLNPLQGQDRGDQRNRKYFVNIRSKSDFNKFLVAMKSELNTPNTAKKDEDPQEAAIKAMETLLTAPAPVYPGMYRER